ncbi:MAG: hypothetical protein KME20_03215, partial [Kaiparowitsia implicata GSE-PSE-MK54-09C]|nr:hypothetical protein [Kaiparowitsia implicata GSE-PSE-MK54-09C]
FWAASFSVNLTVSSSIRNPYPQPTHQVSLRVAVGTLFMSNSLNAKDSDQTVGAQNHLLL